MGRNCRMRWRGNNMDNSDGEGIKTVVQSEGEIDVLNEGI